MGIMIRSIVFLVCVAFGLAAAVQNRVREKRLGVGCYIANGDVVCPKQDKLVPGVVDAKATTPVVKATINAKKSVVPVRLGKSKPQTTPVIKAPINAKKSVVFVRLGKSKPQTTPVVKAEINAKKSVVPVRLGKSKPPTKDASALQLVEDEFNKMNEEIKQVYLWKDKHDYRDKQKLSRERKKMMILFSLPTKRRKCKEKVDSALAKLRRFLDVDAETIMRKTCDKIYTLRKQFAEKYLQRVMLSRKESRHCGKTHHKESYLSRLLVLDIKLKRSHMKVLKVSGKIRRRVPWMLPWYRRQRRKVRKLVEQQRKECATMKNKFDRFTDEFSKLGIVYSWAMQHDQKTDEALNCLKDKSQTDEHCSEILMKNEERFEYVENRFQCAISSTEMPSELISTLTKGVRTLVASETTCNGQLLKKNWKKDGSYLFNCGEESASGTVSKLCKQFLGRSTSDYMFPCRVDGKDFDVKFEYSQSKQLYLEPTINDLPVIKTCKDDDILKERLGNLKKQGNQETMEELYMELLKDFGEIQGIESKSVRNDFASLSLRRRRRKLLQQRRQGC
jgi:hypothetical protein